MFASLRKVIKRGLQNMIPRNAKPRSDTGDWFGVERTHTRGPCLPTHACDAVVSAKRKTS